MNTYQSGLLYSVVKGWDASGSSAFLTPGSGIQDVKKSESGMKIFDNIYESLLTFYGLKYNALSIQCCGSGILEEG